MQTSTHECSRTVRLRRIPGNPYSGVRAVCRDANSPFATSAKRTDVLHARCVKDAGRVRLDGLNRHRDPVHSMRQPGTWIHALSPARNVARPIGGRGRLPSPSPTVGLPPVPGPSHGSATARRITSMGSSRVCAMAGLAAFARVSFHCPRWGQRRHFAGQFAIPAAKRDADAPQRRPRGRQRFTVPPSQDRWATARRLSKIAAVVAEFGSKRCPLGRGSRRIAAIPPYLDARYTDNDAPPVRRVWDHVLCGNASKGYNGRRCPPRCWRGSARARDTCGRARADRASRTVLESRDPFLQLVRDQPLAVAFDRRSISAGTVVSLWRAVRSSASIPWCQQLPDSPDES